MIAWVPQITRMMSEVLFEKLVKQVVWRWPKKLISAVIGKKSADRQQAPLIEVETNSPHKESVASPAAPAAMGPQHDASNYRLRLIGGAYVYEFHAGLEDGHDSCWACQKCFDDGKVSLLQPDFQSVEIHEHSVEWTCSECDRCYLINQRESPPNW